MDGVVCGEMLAQVYSVEPNFNVKRNDNTFTRDFLYYDKLRRYRINETILMQVYCMLFTYMLECYLNT